MRFTFTVVALASALALAAPPAAPQPATAGASAYKRALREVSLRIKYPELFKRITAEEPLPSHEVCIDPCTGLPDPDGYCYWTTDPVTDTQGGVGRKKRNQDPTSADGKEILTPEHAARFFLGRGEYIHENGTYIVDSHYLTAGEHRRSLQMKRSRLTNWAASKLGNMVMDLGMPIYRRWKTHYADQPDYVFALSDTHAFRMRDLPHIERALLDTPGWDEIEVAEWRLSRRFLEVASQL